MNLLINLKGPHTPEEARLVARGRQLQESADSVMKDVRQAPSDSVQLDAHGTDDRLGSYAYVGSIGKEKFAKAQVWVQHDGHIEGFVAQKSDGTWFKHDLPKCPDTKDQFYAVDRETFFFSKDGVLVYTTLD